MIKKMDLPQEPAIVHEYFMETEEETSAEKNLKIADLSFYHLFVGKIETSSNSVSFPHEIIIINQKDHV